MSARDFLHNLPLPAGQLAGMISAAFFDRVEAVRLPGSRAAHWATGSVLMLAGCALTGWALMERRRRAVDAFDLERPQELVTTGPYALSRHPMYVGWWLIHLGFGVSRGSAWVLLTVPSAVLVEHRAVISEERRLGQAFGRRFFRYAERVPRYLPFSIARRRTGPRHAAIASPK